MNRLTINMNKISIIVGLALLTAVIMNFHPIRVAADGPIDARRGKVPLSTLL